MEQLSFYSLRTTAGYTSSIGTYEGKQHIIVPVVMMVEGVHAGSAGPLFHPIAELGKFPASWDGMPVMVQHPQDAEGNYISANSPLVLQASKVGRIFSTNVDGKKLKAEAWFDSEKLANVSSEAAEAIKNNSTLEVSIGVFTINEEIPGEYNGEQYSAIARSHRPDHLAILPGGTGACSVADGCGLRVNSKEGGKMSELTVFNAIKFMNKEGYTISGIGVNKDGYNATVDSLRRKLDSLDNTTQYHYLEEVFDDYVIYVRRNREAGGHMMFKQNYQITNELVELIGNPVEVTKKVKVTYVPMTVINNQNENQMAEKECSPCVKEKVNTLIAHAKTAFSEGDRTWLEGLQLDQLAKLDPKEEATPAVNSVDPITLLTPAQKAMYELGVNTIKEKRNTLIQGIQANTSKEIWPDEILNNMDETILEKLFTSVKKVEVSQEAPMNYGIRGAHVINVNAADDVPVLYPTGYEVKQSK